METFKKTIKWLAGVGFSLCAIAAAIVLGIRLCLDRTEWAAWVQAVGAICALGVAIFVMSRQNAHAAKLVIESDLRAIKRKGQSVAVLVERALSHLENALQIIPIRIRRGNQEIAEASLLGLKLRIDEARRALIAIPAHELGSYGMTSALQDMIDRTKDAQELLESGSFVELFPVVDVFEGKFTNIIESARRANDSFQAALKSL